MVGGQQAADSVGVAELTLRAAALLPGRRTKRSAALLILIGGAAFFALPTHAGADAARRVCADILVMAGDAGRLADPALKPIHRRGLKDRIAGTLATLALSVRRARDATPGLPPLPPASLAAARAALAEDDVAALAAQLGEMSARYPFPTTGLLPADRRPAALGRARRLHEKHCAGCHDSPDLETERPAWNLSRLARAMPAGAFAARMVVGVRGTNLMAMENPLTDAEISALVGFYLGDEATE